MHTLKADCILNIYIYVYVTELPMYVDAMHQHQEYCRGKKNNIVMGHSFQVLTDKIVSLSSFYFQLDSAHT